MSLFFFFYKKAYKPLLKLSTKIIGTFLRRLFKSLNCYAGWSANQSYFNHYTLVSNSEEYPKKPTNHIEYFPFSHIKLFRYFCHFSQTVSEQSLS